MSVIILVQEDQLLKISEFSDLSVGGEDDSDGSRERSGIGEKVAK